MFNKLKEAAMIAAAAMSGVDETAPLWYEELDFAYEEGGEVTLVVYEPLYEPGGWNGSPWGWVVKFGGAPGGMDRSVVIPAWWFALGPNEDDADWLVRAAFKILDCLGAWDKARAILDIYLEGRFFIDGLEKSDEKSD